MLVGNGAVPYFERMIHPFARLAAVFLLVSGNTLRAEEIDIYKFAEVNNGTNHGRQIPADLVYLKADGTEGEKGSAGVTPAIKVVLSPMPKTNSSGIDLLAQIDHLVMQDITTGLASKTGSVGVDVWASPDFKRAATNAPNAQVGPGDFNGFVMTLPDMDFWIIRGTQHTFFSYLKPGAWTHVEGKFGSTLGHFEFHVPPGTGFVYLKDFVVSP